jgi:hypothetical protein
VATNAVFISASAVVKNIIEPAMIETIVYSKQPVYPAKLPELLQRLRGDLIVSCQAVFDELRSNSETMPAIAITTVEAGTIAIRANTIKDEIAISQVVTPLIIDSHKNDWLSYTVNAPIEQFVHELVCNLIHLSMVKNKCKFCFANRADHPPFLWISRLIHNIIRPINQKYIRRPR